MSRLAKSNKEDWNLYLTALRFTMNETSEFSLYFMLFGRDVVQPMDNLLKLRRKYMGEDYYKIIQERQHKIFAQVKRRIRRTQKRRNKRMNKGRKEVELISGNLV